MRNVVVTAHAALAIHVIHLIYVRLQILHVVLQRALPVVLVILVVALV